MAAASIALGLHSACLLPPPVEQVGGNNLPPRILVESLDPAPNGPPLLMDFSCINDVVFTASVSDPDGAPGVQGNDTLWYRVFVDHWEDPVRSKENADPTPLNLSPNDSSSLITFRVNSENFGSLAAAAHTIELYVADSDFRDRGDEGPLTGRVLVNDEAFVDSFVWTVIFEDGAPCP